MDVGNAPLPIASLIDISQRPVVGVLGAIQSFYSSPEYESHYSGVGPQHFHPGVRRVSPIARDLCRDVLMIGPCEVFIRYRVDDTPPLVREVRGVKSRDLLKVQGLP